MPKNGPAKSGQSVIGLFRALGADPKTLPRTRPLYRRIVDLLEGGIARGDVPPGYRLPPERDLAKALRISRATVVTAYRELESRGLLRGYVGRGTFVSAKPDAGSAPFAWRGKIAAAALQASGDTTVRDVCERLEATVAYTTVMTTMDRLFKKRLLSRHKAGRAFVYRAAVSREELESAIAGELVQTLLETDGSEPLPILSSLVDAVSDRDRALLDELERLVREKRRAVDTRRGSGK